jgi:hypothetical protein
LIPKKMLKMDGWYPLWSAAKQTNNQCFVKRKKTGVFTVNWQLFTRKI